ncbi:hypothetical protein GCM10009127_14750 [Alteraurantiacibacter aestuarii]|uniref:SURF1-like protein n=1 Tax=Alteraurantiacibacter aestuarii TaxID=650004 RepID=A0A844ZJI1_9SPHN|nr:SURF1 family protein [Alteraurantiacibacter aestuarii]MXO87938.1 SURF1 family protein [Alteraurantiacibacter aestuarii]
MTRKIPIIPTIIVLAAVATMIALGFWQLGRLDEKEALIARYQAQIADDEVVLGNFGDPDALFRRASFYCDQGRDASSISGRNARGVAGWAHIVTCTTGSPDTGSQAGAPSASAVLPEEVDLVLGWSRDPELAEWTQGQVEGIVARGGERGWRIVADPPLEGLEPNATPDPADLPNNHLAYAGQWFFFALTALVIYILALRRRWR